VGVGREQQLAIVTTKGRALRIGLNAVSFRGVQALKRDKDEWIVGCVPVREPDRLLLVTDSGAARLIPAALVPLAAEPNMRGRAVAARAAVRSAARHDPEAPLWLLTSRYLRPVGPDHLRAAMAAPARNPFALATLGAGEQVVALVARPR
jgi:hypothetical protein